jgi:hypothetical protein
VALGDRIVNFVVKISGDVRDLTQDLNRVERDATQATGRLQTAAGRAGSFVRENWMGMAAGAGVAVAGFATKAIGDFTNLALGVDKFRTTSGLTLDDASRWTEVANDLGLSSESIATSFAKMNRAAASGGLEGITDAQDPNQRFLDILNYLSQIEDETELATEAQRIFGRSWQDLAPLISSLDTIKTRLDDVSDSQIIDQEEIDKARRYKDAMDGLGDAYRDISLIVGEVLAPALSDVADAITGIKDALEDLPSPPDWLMNLLTVSWKDLIAPLPGGSGDMARTPQDILFPPAPAAPPPSRLQPSDFEWRPSTTNVTINTGADPQAVVDAVRRYQRSNNR